MTNFWFDPAEAPGVPRWATGVRGDPKVIFFIAEAYATTLVTFVDWAKLIFCDVRTDKQMDGQTDLPVKKVI